MPPTLAVCRRFCPSPAAARTCPIRLPPRPGQRLQGRRLPASVTIARKKPLAQGAPAAAQVNLPRVAASPSVRLGPAKRDSAPPPAGPPPPIPCGAFPMRRATVPRGLEPAIRPPLALPGQPVAALTERMTGPVGLPLRVPPRARKDVQPGRRMKTAPRVQRSGLPLAQAMPGGPSRPNQLGRSPKARIEPADQPSRAPLHPAAKPETSTRILAR
jgi:hypothetical protein